MKEASMLGKAFAITCLSLALWGPAMAVDETTEAEKALINTLMQRQVLIAVSNVDNADTVVEDNDPNTMQIVFLTDPNAKARVSDDGEVVYVPPGLSITQQNWLTDEAFKRKARRIIQGKH
jgi:hypothetical protein